MKYLLTEVSDNEEEEINTPFDVSNVLVLREPLGDFALLMESKLRKHDVTRGPRGWITNWQRQPGVHPWTESQKLQFLHQAIIKEGSELQGALSNLQAYLSINKHSFKKLDGPSVLEALGASSVEELIERVQEEAADLANQAMMLSDLAGTLKTENDDA